MTMKSGSKLLFCFILSVFLASCNFTSQKIEGTRLFITLGGSRSARAAEGTVTASDIAFWKGTLFEVESETGEYQKEIPVESYFNEKLGQNVVEINDIEPGEYYIRLNGFDNDDEMVVVAEPKDKKTFTVEAGLETKVTLAVTIVKKEESKEEIPEAVIPEEEKPAEEVVLKAGQFKAETLGDIKNYVKEFFDDIDNQDETVKVEIFGNVSVSALNEALDFTSVGLVAEQYTITVDMYEATIADPLSDADKSVVKSNISTTLSYPRDYKGWDGYNGTTGEKGVYISPNDLITQLIGNSLEGIYAAGNKNLIYVNTNMESVSDEAFKNCEKLLTVYISDSAKTIGKSAFEGCTSLASINLTNIENIGNRAFYGCSSLYSLGISDWKKVTVGEAAFEGVMSSYEEGISGVVLIPVILRNYTGIKLSGQNEVTVKIINNVSVTDLNTAFAGLEDIVTAGKTFTVDLSGATLSYPENDGNVMFKPSVPYRVIYPDTCTEDLILNAEYVGQLTYFKAKNITGLSVSSNVPVKIIDLSETKLTAIGEGNFSGNAYLEQVILPDTVTTIGNSAFKGCTSLSSINLEKVVTIGAYAFDMEGGVVGKLTEINLSACKEIGAYAFRYCWPDINTWKITDTSSYGVWKKSDGTAISATELPGILRGGTNEVALTR